jgi:Mn-containing catalase
LIIGGLDMYEVVLIFPKNREILEKKYAKVLADIVAEELTHDELGYLISELEKQNTNLA